MEYIGIGIDVSKGRADIAIINQSGTELAGSGGYDDTHKDHERLRGVLRDLRRRFPESTLLAGVEATGGHERNWVGLCKREHQAGRSVVIHRLNPLAVKRFLEADLHRKVDDRQAAVGIARFLLARMREKTALDIPLDGKVVFYRQIRSLIETRKQLSQRFQNLLPSANPELVQYCHDGLPDWILAVCARYPTAAHLRRAGRDALAGISHVGVVKADSMMAAAKDSTAALTDEGTACTIRMQVAEITGLDARIEAGKDALIAMMPDDKNVQLIDGIPGIGPWSAHALMLEIGDPARFKDVRQLIAWAGLDPREDESGDGVIRRGISHRGNTHLRAILFPLAMAAMMHHPVVSAFIAKKKQEGKHKKVALVAGAAKILRIVYALLVTQKPYDAQHEANRARPDAKARQKARSGADAAASPQPSLDLTAPISAKEVRKRRVRHQAAAPQSQVNEVRPQRGPRAAAPRLSTPVS